MRRHAPDNAFVGLSGGSIGTAGSGFGDGSTLPVYESEIGRLGSVITPRALSAVVLA
jgi:hypothetical protein